MENNRVQPKKKAFVSFSHIKAGSLVCGLCLLFILCISLACSPCKCACIGIYVYTWACMRIMLSDLCGKLYSCSCKWEVSFFRAMKAQSRTRRCGKIAASGALIVHPLPAPTLSPSPTNSLCFPNVKLSRLLGAFSPSLVLAGRAARAGSGPVSLPCYLLPCFLLGDSQLIQMTDSRQCQALAGV